MNGPAMIAAAHTADPGERAPFPFAGPPYGAQGAYPGLFMEGANRWNNHAAPGSGSYGWKFDVEKEIPYYDLAYSGARNLMSIPCTPLRVSKRWANSLLWSIFNAYQNAATWVQMKVGGWKKDRNRRESETLARVLDLAITEFGTRVIEKSAAFGVLLRRLHAITLADTQGHWELACLMEEVPSSKTPLVHEVIVKDLVTLSQLIDKTAETGKGTKTPGLDE